MFEPDHLIHNPFKRLPKPHSPSAQCRLRQSPPESINLCKLHRFNNRPRRTPHPRRLFYLTLLHSTNTTAHPINTPLPLSLHHRLLNPSLHLFLHPQTHPNSRPPHHQLSPLCTLHRQHRRLPHRKRNPYPALPNTRLHHRQHCRIQLITRINPRIQEMALTIRKPGVRFQDHTMEPKRTNHVGESVGGEVLNPNCGGCKNRFRRRRKWISGLGGEGIINRRQWWVLLRARLRLASCSGGTATSLMRPRTKLRARPLRSFRRPTTDTGEVSICITRAGKRGLLERAGSIAGSCLVIGVGLAGGGLRVGDAVDVVTSGGVGGAVRGGGEGDWA